MLQFLSYSLISFVSIHLDIICQYAKFDSVLFHVPTHRGRANKCK